MAFAGHDHHLGERLEPDSRGRFDPNAAKRPAKRERKARYNLNRISWILAGMMLGAAAGWMIFQAFLNLVTLD